jgi:hypothetical protein
MLLELKENLKMKVLEKRSFTFSVEEKKKVKGESRTEIIPNSEFFSEGEFFDYNSFNFESIVLILTLRL